MRKINWKKRSLALALSAVMLTGVLAGSALQARAVANSNTNKWDNVSLGQLSAKYETGNVTDPGIVADVNGDIGGTSFGIYMFAKSANTPYLFAQWCQKQPVYASIGDQLVRAYEYNSAGQYFPGYGSNFKSTWKAVAAAQTTLFAQAQHDYVEDQIYGKVVTLLENNVGGFKIANYTDALKNVLWSRGVQHGVDGAYSMVCRAFESMGGFKGQSETELIDAIYTESGRLLTAADGKSGAKLMTGMTAQKYGVENKALRYYYGNSGDVQLGVYYRLRINEPSDALEIYCEKNNAQWREGTYTMVASGTNYLGADLSLGASQDSWTLTPFAGGYYTITAADGTRLAADGGQVKLLGAAAGDAQKWVWSADTTSWKNVGTDKYLVASGNGVSLSDEPRGWAVNASGTSWGLYGAYYPGVGGNNMLYEGESAFPIRGVITSNREISSVSVSVLSSTGSAVNYASKTKSVSVYAYSLDQMDDDISVSKLPAGDYTFTVKATIGGQSTEILSKPFTVNARRAQGEDPTSENPTEDEFTVTFDPAGGKFDGGAATYTKVVRLGEPYGKLPMVTKDGETFAGWFLDDTQVAPNSIAAASDHTLTARYGKLYTYTFLKSDGKVFKTGQLAEGTLIPNPGNTTKASDGTYIYSFSHWVVQGTDTRYISGTTFISTADVTFTPVFTSEKITSGGSSSGGTTSGGGTSGGGEVTGGSYLTGITPGTTVAGLSGYTVYKNGSQVTGGNLATGMTARSGSTEVTIVVIGDTSGDGKISITDVVKLQSHVVGKTTLSGAYAKAADVNRDGSVSITDVVQAAQVTVGKRTIG